MIRLACFVSLGLGVFSFLIFVVTLLQRPRADRGPELTSGPEGWAKLGEAGAKVIDAFTKAGPTLSALIASLFFVGVGAYLSLNVPPSKPPEQKVITIGSSVIRCVIEGFPDGERRRLNKRLLRLHRFDGKTDLPGQAAPGLNHWQSGQARTSGETQ
jgi:hypothetical protein